MIPVEQNDSRTESPTMTIPEVAKALSLGLIVTYQLARQNKLPVPVLRLNKQYRVGRLALMAAINGKDA